MKKLLLAILLATFALTPMAQARHSRHDGDRRYHHHSSGRYYSGYNYYPRYRYYRPSYYNTGYYGYPVSYYRDCGNGYGGGYYGGYYPQRRHHGAISFAFGF